MTGYNFFSAEYLKLQSGNELNFKSESELIDSIFFQYRGRETTNSIESYQFFRGKQQNYDYADIYAKNLRLSGNLYPINNSRMVQIFSGEEFTKGGHLALFGNDYIENAGCFMLCATTANNNVHRLIGDKNGSLTWDNCHIEYLTNKLMDNNGFICYGSKLKIQWGETICNGIYQAFPTAFSTTKRCIVAMSTPFGSNEFGAIIMETAGYQNDRFGFGLYCYNIQMTTMDTKKIARWIAIGY